MLFFDKNKTKIIKKDRNKRAIKIVVVYQKRAAQLLLLQKEKRE